jgi:hypothetical protein
MIQSYSPAGSQAGQAAAGFPRLRRGAHVRGLIHAWIFPIEKLLICRNFGVEHEHAVPTSSEQACRLRGGVAAGWLCFYREGIEIGVVIVCIDALVALEETDYPICKRCQDCLETDLEDII